MNRGIGTTITVAQARQAAAQARLAHGPGHRGRAEHISGLDHRHGDFPPLTQMKIAMFPIGNCAINRQFRREGRRDALAHKLNILSHRMRRKRQVCAIVSAAEADFLPKVFIAE